jgi:hypothetical protein
MIFYKETASVNSIKEMLAKEAYKYIVGQLVRKDYELLFDSEHEDLTELYRRIWQSVNKGYIETYEENSEECIAFNYANSFYKNRDDFLKLAKSLVNDQDRKSDQEILDIAKKLDFSITNNIKLFFAANFIKLAA